MSGVEEPTSPKTRFAFVVSSTGADADDSRSEHTATAARTKHARRWRLKRQFFAAVSLCMTTPTSFGGQTWPLTAHANLSGLSREYGPINTLRSAFHVRAATQDYRDGASLTACLGVPCATSAMASDRNRILMILLCVASVVTRTLQVRS